MRVQACPNCQSRRQYMRKDLSAGGGNAPDYLKGLGGRFTAEKFNVVICADCGLTRFFARKTAVDRLSEAKDWERI